MRKYSKKRSPPSQLIIFFLLWPIVDGKDTVRNQQVFQQAPMPMHDGQTGFGVDGTLITTPKGPILPQSVLSITYSGKHKKIVHL